MRFKTWFKGSPVTLDIVEGETLVHRWGNPTDEGYESCETVWEFYDGTLYKTVEYAARDCDGPVYTHNEYIAHEVQDGYPVWTRILERCRQRDVYAEMMGY